MAYNLQSLITILEQILNPQQTRWILGRKKPQFQSLLEKAASLQLILEKYSLTRVESLVSDIRDAAHQAEDIIESHMVDRMLSTAEGVGFALLTADVQQATQQLDSLMELVVILVELVKVQLDIEKILTSSSSSGASYSSFNDYLVGVGVDLVRLKDRVMGMQSELEIVPIVGMGGIGKTTLARKLYQDPDIVEHFTYLTWATVSQDYDIRAIILSLLRCIIGKEVNQHIEKRNHKLKDILYKSLYGRRYLIVLDDVWSIRVWDEIGMYLPDNNNRSRIMITTRESEVAKYASSHSKQHEMRLLDESESWSLLRHIVFGDEADCPHGLRKIGTKIARHCRGLPLAIHVIGGLLSKAKRSRAAWKYISIDVEAAIFESDEQFSSILSLSYNYLPNHLKPFFLYFGAFPEDCEIKGSRLKDIWIAEGFVKSNGYKSLEEVAEYYLTDLVERNLILVTKRKSNGKPMSYRIHDFLRDICRRKADEEKFLRVQSFSNQRRVSVHSSYEKEDVCASPESMSFARSFICTEKMILSPIFSLLRLVRVLDVMEMVFQEFPREILELVNLRFLAFYCALGLPIGISRLWNLQTLISRQDVTSVPSEIWEISELRHLRLKAVIEIEEGYKFKIVHEKLQTIYMLKMTPSLIRSGFFKRIPNIKKLGIFYIDSPDIAVDLSHLHKLETLKCQSELNVDGSRFLPKIRFPRTLRKLTLVGCVIFGSFLTTLCALPNLEVLKIRGCNFEGDEADDQVWDVVEGVEFCLLQYLHLESLNLVQWRADETNFPRLHRLSISECSELEEIPSGVGEIPTLELIELEKCSNSVVASAKQIVEEQQSYYDNYDLQLRIS